MKIEVEIKITLDPIQLKALVEALKEMKEEGKEHD